MVGPSHLGGEVCDLGAEDRGEVLVLAQVCRDDLDMSVANVWEAVETAPPVPSVFGVVFTSTMSSASLSVGRPPGSSAIILRPSRAKVLMS